MLDSARRAKPILKRELSTKNHLRCGHNIPGTPVSTLTHCNGIHTLVDTPYALPTVYISEHSPSRWRLDTSSGLLVARDFSRLHTRAETLQQWSVKKTQLNHRVCDAQKTWVRL
jgi:hypothetical protein